MKQEKDIRYYRTKQRITAAMVRLLKEKNFDQITVKDICEYAEISRSGFYLHYLDKYDLAEKHQLELLAHANKIIQTASQSTIKRNDLMLHMLNYLKNDGELLALLISDHGSPEIQNQVKQLLKKNALKNIIAHINIQLDTETEKHYLVTFLSNAILGVLQEWINTGQKESPEDLVQIMNKIVSFEFT
ncbi:TetR-like C-terminal domain-containing protein [Enterococcus sp. AZ072]|uniref:TetR/AcrR family transcriptional regulator n=1 Tax=unclassified Enterococcus TaxID=2608891 RepID=UPI003D29D02A